MKTESNLTVKICMGSSCFARGNNENLLLIEQFIKQHNLEATIELLGSRCENKCADGPHICINNKEYKNVSKDYLKSILSDSLFTKKRKIT